MNVTWQTTYLGSLENKEENQALAKKEDMRKEEEENGYTFPADFYKHFNNTSLTKPYFP